MDLGPYRVLAQVGAGPDAVAFRAEDPRAGLAVRLTILHPELARARRKQLGRRLGMAALLDHPGAVRILEAALLQEPPYFVQEWLDAPTLDAVLTPPLPAAAVLALAAELAGILAAAHRLGLSHAELAPTTIRQAATGLKVDFSDVATPAGPLSAAGVRLTRACRAPELGRGEPADFAADVFSLGALLVWLGTGAPLADHAVPAGLPWPEDAAWARWPLEQLLREMLADDPGARPWSHEVAQRLAAFTHAGAAVSPNATAIFPANHAPPRDHIGRYRILEKLGQGGMGEVYRALDPSDGTVVAIKTVRADRDRPDLLRRIHKEARLLAEVNNPHVANLLEINEQDGLPYLVLEFVPGRTLAALIDEGGPLPEPAALTVIADVARALAEAHRRGIVHRDIKPDNILLVRDPSSVVRGPEASAGAADDGLRAKLSDFGLARHVNQSESLELTQTGTIVGTPLYLAPEQCQGLEISPAADVYAMGATLFTMLAGRPPFLGDTPLQVMSAHCGELPPPLRQFNPAASDGVCQLVSRCLAKAPGERYPGAAELLADVERLRGGEPTSMALHPRLPKCDPRDVLLYEFRWELQAAPDQLWPYVSNTERLNRAIGLNAVRFTVQHDPARGMRRFASVRKVGLALAWEEHPFEWVAPRRFGVLREFSQGPFAWFISLVELTARTDGGTTLTHQLRVLPRGLVGRAIAAVEIGFRARRSMERVYRRIDSALAAGGRGELLDPFEEPPPLTAAQQQQLDALLEQLGRHGIPPAVTERLGDWLAQAPPQEAARIRPLALARRLALDPDAVTAACLHGARAGLFLLLWDILCPLCRVPTESKDSLRDLGSHAHCEACNLDFEQDFASSVEMIFRVHPAIRPSELATYCIGGPAHSPHVVAQVRLLPGERIELDVALTAGDYQLRGPQLPGTFNLRVQPAAPTTRFIIRIPADLNPVAPAILRAGRQTLVLTNESAQELQLRLERSAARDDALTAARAAALALFRELFPDEVLSPDQLIRIATVTLLAVEVAEVEKLYAIHGDAPTFHVIRQFLQLTGAEVKRHGGAVVKTIGAGLLAVFDDPAAAVRCAQNLPSMLTADTKTASLQIKAAVHRGPALAATVDGQLDYFGATAHEVLVLMRKAAPGEVVMTEDVATAAAGHVIRNTSK